MDFQDVRAFHVKFDLPVDDGQPELMSADQLRFRLGFMNEELDEYADAVEKENLVEAADALFDFVYVVFGTVLFLRLGNGYPFNTTRPSFNSVHVEALRLGYITSIPRSPQFLSANLRDLMELRMRLEVDHFHWAHDSEEPSALPLSISHLWNAARAAYLTAVFMGIPWERCWRHVQAANMAKTRAASDGSDSKRGSSWDVIKPPGWRAPDLAIAQELISAGSMFHHDVLREAENASRPKA